jgi:aspartate kinase
MAVAVGLAFGPTLGGFIAENLGWRWLFYINLPIAVTAVIAAFRILPEDRPPVRGRLDIAGRRHATATEKRPEAWLMRVESLGHGLVTDEAHTRARIKRISAERIHAALDAGRVAVVAGFQGTTEAGEITTLGRGGSDLTGVALAAALKADVCEIFTDVDGVYTADPNVVPDARKLPRISYDEMLEMAALGAKVLQARSVEFAKKYNVPVHVRSTFKPDPGTLVTREDHSMEDVVVTGVTHDRGQAKVSILRVPDRTGIASRMFGGLAKQNIVVDMIVQNISRDGFTDISFTLPRADRTRAEGVLGELAREVGAQGVVADDRVAKISIVGVGMRSHAGVAARMFETLSAEGINIQMISTSEIAVSCVIEDKYTELAVRALHDVFALGAERRA